MFVKKTRAKRLSDTVFFKHKYITQPTVTTAADAMVNAYHKLKQAINGVQHSKDYAQMEALERIKQVFDTANNCQAEVPTVEQTKQNELTQPVPRVTFKDESPPSQLVIASSNEPVVVSPEKREADCKPEAHIEATKIFYGTQI